MKPFYRFLFVSAFAALLAACGGQAQQSNENDENSEGDGQEMADKPLDLTFTLVPPTPDYPDASIALVAPQVDARLPAGEPVSFDFDVEGGEYQLGAQTQGAEGLGCANSGKGQHIHLILNNGPYMAKYESEFDVELEEGYYHAIAFLSRSYHQSIKNNKSFVVFDFQVGEGNYERTDLYGEQLFYSRPKGEYSGTDADKIMLDFFLNNTKLTDTGDRIRKVRVSVDGTVYKEVVNWPESYFIEGLPAGAHTIKLELVDGEGEVVNGQTVEREIIVSELQ